MIKPKFELPQKQQDIVKDIQSWALRTELDERQKNYLDSLVAQLNKILSGRTVEQMMAEKDLSNLEKYLETITRIKKLLKDKEMPLERSIKEQKADWEAFYRDKFGFELDLSNLKIPEHQEGFDRLIIVSQEISYLEILGGMHKEFEVDNGISSFRMKDQRGGTYAVWIRDNNDADSEFEGLSANEVGQRNVLGATLKERLLYETKYFYEKHKNLDQNTSTLCTGSRTPEGFVPVVEYDGGEVCIKLIDNKLTYKGLRARQIIAY